MPSVSDIGRHLRGVLPTVPATAVVAGSGVMDAVHALPLQATIPYSDVGLPSTSVAGHQPDILLVCSEQDVPFLVFGGRYHLYEGHTMDAVLTLVRLCHALGIRNVLLTNAAGGLAPGLRRGSLMLASDLLTLPWRYRHGAMGQERRPMLDASWNMRIERTMLRNGLALARGTYVQVPGPSYETRAEIHMLRKLGGHAVGMSTACEAQEAAMLGMHVAACSMITNETSDTIMRSVQHEEVLQTAAVARRYMTALLHAAVDTAAG